MKMLSAGKRLLDGRLLAGGQDRRLAGIDGIGYGDLGGAAEDEGLISDDVNGRSGSWAFLVLFPRVESGYAGFGSGRSSGSGRGNQIGSGNSGGVRDDSCKVGRVRDDL